MSATCNLLSNGSAKYVHVRCSPEEGQAGKALVRQQESGRGMTAAAWLPVEERRPGLGEQREALQETAVYSWRGLGRQGQGEAPGEAVRGAGR